MSRKTDRNFTRREFLKTTTAMAMLSGMRPVLAAEAQVAREPARDAMSPAPLEVTALGRLTFGPRGRDLETFRALGPTFERRLAKFVEQQLHPASIKDPVCDAKLGEANLTTLTKPLALLWKDHKAAADALREAEKAAPGPGPGGGPSGAQPKSPAKVDENRLRQQPIRETEIATWLRAVYSERQLFEVLVDFWHNHFNVYGWDNPVAAVFVHYDRDVIRKHALGNFREMLEAMTKSPAMLFYLDNFVNQSGNPNENFARELFELHTLGAENYLGTADRAQVKGFATHGPVGYVDGDVYEAARALTGWRVDQGAGSGNTGEFNYYDGWHDRFQKIVLGKAFKEYAPPMRDGGDVLDLVAFHPGTSRYVARKLCRRLVSDNPPDKLVERAAKVFREKKKAPDQLLQAVRVIVLSDEFQNTSREKMKRPFEAVAGQLRVLEADFFPSDPFLNNYARAGQRLFQWRTPDGYPDVHIRWGGTTPMLERWRMANQIAYGQLERVKVDFTSTLKLSGDTPAQLAQYWSQRVLGYPMAPARVAEITEFLSQGRNPTSKMSESLVRERVPAAVALALMSPEFQWR